MTPDAGAAGAGTSRLWPILVLAGCGATWGLTLPLIRIAVSTGHAPLGIMLSQQIIMAAVCAALLVVLRLPVPGVRGRLGLYAGVAGFGAVLPGYFTFLTAALMPAGVRSILIAVVPMFTLPMAIALGFERPDLRRALGVLLGAAAIVLIAVPDAGVADAAVPVSVGVVLLALVPPVSYAVEANFLAWRGSDGLHPFQLLLGASILGAAATWPLAEATGEMLALPPRWGAAEYAIFGAGVLNAMAYAGYVWMVGRAGSVFASQIAYLVTAFGVGWSMLLLDERYPATVWVAFALMLAGVALVQPRAGRAEEP
ncbi:DMT family transporter [Amaricoccus sp.]|uniref:DMT family transporter n=1 Tax=Amaricoccus sp. TaxID=1872485 RepID=UPI001B695085|nr:DMT family transporter [Amaricoccus sp.]MBP7241656.1 DMT family transporter [Amaricoccus sp.]